MVVLSNSHVPVTRSELPWAIRQGILAGIVAGLVFAAFEMIASAVMMGPAALTMPLRMIGGIALGSRAMAPDFPLATAALAGIIVHMILAMIYGGVFAALAGGLRPGPAVIGLAGAYGVLLWLINFYLIAPAAFPWFAQANPVVAFVGHAVFFGAVLGYVLWRAHERLLKSAR
jgi:hypothetical protein